VWLREVGRRQILGIAVHVMGGLPL
jgi:hypothetical protein